MSQPRLLMCVVKRENGEEFVDFFKNKGISDVFHSLCRGTASKSTLDYLGLEDTEKMLFQTVTDKEGADALMRDILYRMQIDIPGNGIALSIPLDAATQNNDNSREVENMNQTPYLLMTVIAEKGFSDMIMDAARSAGARGGTIINAKGTGAEFQPKFFGVSIAAEKEIIYIVTRRADGEAIMNAIIEKAGPETDAHASVIGVPVESVEGLRSITDIQ